MSLLLVDQGILKVSATGPMTTHKHHIVYKSQGGTDDPSNLVELDFISHAELHANDFLSGGPSFDFRHKGYKYLDENLRNKLREEKSRRQKGSESVFLHDGRSARGTQWWNNGKEQVRRKKCPGEGWVEGCLPDTNAKKGRPGVPKSEEWKENMTQMRVGDRNPCAGRRWVTNGDTNLYLKPEEQTPPNYKPGRTL